MPSIGQTHYRCGFDLRPKETAASWGDVIKTVRSWISGLNPEAEGMGGRWFYTGGDWKDARSAVTHIHVRAGLVRTGEESPDCWALRFEHPCREMPHRLWITDVGVTRLDNGDYRFLLHLYHRLNPNYIGPEPSTPVPTAPRVIATLFRSTRFAPVTGCLSLTDKPLIIALGEGKRFHDLLRDDSRLAPIVLVSPLHENGLPLIDTVTLARRLIGNAVVYVSASAEVDEELDYFLGDAFRCRDGMVRIFQPRVKFGTSDFRRHRFFLRDQIRADGVEVVYGQITAALNRRARRWIGLGCESIEDVESEVRRHRLAELLASAKDDQTTELLQLYEAENAKLTTDLDDARRRIDELELSVEERGEQIESAGHRERQARVDVNNAHERARNAETRLATIGDIPRLPTSITEVVALIGRLHTGRLVFTQQATKSAKETPFSDIAGCWFCLWNMGTVLYNLHFGDDLSAGEIERRFKDQTGVDLVMTEGKQTKADKRLMNLRRVSHDGKEFDITAHAKLSARNIDLRIHYAVDREKRCLVIGHCGEHLETYGTRRRKEA